MSGIKSTYRILLVIVSLTGLSLAEDIPVGNIRPGSDRTVRITCHGPGWPNERLAMDVVIPLEDALCELTVISSIHSTTTDGAGIIELLLHDPPTPLLMQDILRIVRKVHRSFSNGIPFPQVEFTHQTNVSFLLAVGSRDSIIHAAAWNEYLASRNLTVKTNKTYKENFLESRIVIDHPVSRKLFREQAELSVQSQNTFSDKNGNTIYSDNLYTVFPRAPAWDNLARVNGIPAALFSMSVSPESNALLNLIRLEKSLANLRTKTHDKFSYTILTNPYDILSSSIVATLKRLSFTVAICLLLSLICKYDLNDLWLILLLPGLLMLSWYVLSLRITEQALQVAEATLLLGIIILSPRIACTLTVKGFAGVALGLLIVFWCDFLPESQQIICLSLIGAVGSLILVSLATRGNTTSLGKTSSYPTGILLLILTILIPWLSARKKNTVTDPLTRIISGTSPLPSDKSYTQGEIVLTARAGANLPASEFKTAVRRIITNLEGLKPDELISYQEGRSEKVILRFNSRSLKDLYRIKGLITPMLDRQRLIVWTIEGVGELYQNSHMLLPGKYQVNIRGYDYRKSQEIAISVADSITHLPGIGDAHTGQSGTAEITEYKVLLQEEITDIAEGWNAVRTGFLTLTDWHSELDTLLALTHSYLVDGRVVEGRSLFRFQQGIHPAPVTRINRQFIVPVTYTHYGGEKYASAFHRRLKEDLQNRLPAGYGLHLETPANPDRFVTLRFLLVTLLALLIVFIIFSPSHSISFFYRIGWLMLFYLMYCAIQGYPPSMTLNIMMLFLVIVEYTGRRLPLKDLNYIYCLSGLWGLSHLIIYVRGESYQSGEMIVMVTSLMLIVQILENKLLVSGRCYGFQKSLHLLRLRMVSKLFKRINKVS